jgi:hypothetical protein
MAASSMLCARSKMLARPLDTLRVLWSLWRAPDRLRQPDNLSYFQRLKTVAIGETHGFAPLPRNRLALIVCNHRLAKDQRCLPLESVISERFIKQYWQQFVNKLILSTRPPVFPDESAASTPQIAAG